MQRFTRPTTRTRRTVTVGVVGLLVVLAGCGGLGGGPTASPGTTAPSEEETVGGTPTATPDVEPIDALPPGVDEGGIENATRLLDAHRSEALSDGYRVAAEPVGDGAAEGETITLNQGRDRARLVHETAAGTATYWGAAEQRVVAVNDSAREVTVATGTTGAAADLLELSGRAETAVNPYLHFGEFDPVGMVELDGQRFVKLRATGFNGSALAASPWQVGGDGEVVELAGTVLVTPEGRVGRAEFGVGVEDGDEVVADTFSYRVDSLDEAALAEPEWTESAPHVRARLSDEGDALVLDHRGGAAIPVGTELRLIAGGEVFGTATVPERVGPDERLYVVVVVREDATRDLRVGVGERPSVDGNLLSLRRYDGVMVVGDADGSGFEAGT